LAENKEEKTAWLAVWQCGDLSQCGMDNALCREAVSAEAEQLKPSKDG